MMTRLDLSYLNSTEPKKSLGQHWLHDLDSLERMCELADVQPDDAVLEIGPGLGTLTEQLLLRTLHITAVEYDQNLANQLTQHLPDVTVISQDILEFDLSVMPAGYKVVANIPYYLTSHLVRRLLEDNNQPSRIVLLVQKEVAERITAQPGSMSVLSVMSQLYADVQKADVVPAELFEPAPKVDSQMVVLVPKTDLPDIDTKRFARIVKAGFGERRKKLSNSLAGGLHLPKDQIEAVLEAQGFTPNVRAQELSLEQWHKLYQAFSAKMNSY